MTSVATIRAAVICLLASLLVSCAVPLRDEGIFEDEVTQLQVRSVQSRLFDTPDRIRAMRAVITTLQDLDFVIDQADSRLGVITATRMSGYLLSATVMVTEKDANRMLVRVRMKTGWSPLAEQGMFQSHPLTEEVYQEFFYSIEKNMFLSSRWIPLPKSSAPQ